MSRTEATKALAKAEPTTARCGEPCETTKPPTAPTWFERANTAGVVTPSTVARTSYPPATVLAAALALAALPFDTAVEAERPRARRRRSEGHGDARYRIAIAVEDGDRQRVHELSSHRGRLARREELATTLAGEPGSFVKEKTAGAAAPLTVALTAYAPATRFAEAFTLAFPLTEVRAAAAVREADAPEAGAWKLTVAPGTGFP